MKVTVDSTEETLKHIRQVQLILAGLCSALQHRGSSHDRSKLEQPEKSIFDEYTPKLRHSTYGSDEYKGFLKGMQVALDHHYASNSHHPEHYKNGICGMDLLDLVEMMADWKAATMRNNNGDINRSLAYNKQRFSIGDQLCSILQNTIDRYLA